MDSCIPGGGSDHSCLGAGDCEQNKNGQGGPEAMTGYRWVHVNEYLHSYQAFSLTETGDPQTEVLAYVQMVSPGKFRALRAEPGLNIMMPIPYGPADSMMEMTEKYILNEN